MDFSLKIISNKISDKFNEYIEEYTEELYNKEEDGIIEFILTRFEIKTINYYERVFSININGEWINIHPFMMDECLQSITNKMNDFSKTKFYYRYKSQRFSNHQIITSNLSNKILLKFVS